MFKKKNHPLVGMMYSLGEITKSLEMIAKELKRSNDLKYDIYVWNKKDLATTANSDQVNLKMNSSRGLGDKFSTVYFGEKEPINPKPGDIWWNEKQRTFY